MISMSSAPLLFSFLSKRCLRSWTPRTSLLTQPLRRHLHHHAKAPIALVFDTETTGMVHWRKPSSHESQPHLVQLGMILVDTSDWNRRLMQGSFLVQLHDHVEIDAQAEQVHGISQQQCQRFGLPPTQVAQVFHDMAGRADILVAHNLRFDAKVMEAMIYRELGVEANYSLADSLPAAAATTVNDETVPKQQQRICTMLLSEPILKIPPLPGRQGYKWPSLQEAYTHFYQDNNDTDSDASLIKNAHNAMADAEACLAVFQSLVESGAVNLDEGSMEHEPEKDSTLPHHTATKPADDSTVSLEASPVDTTTANASADEIEQIVSPADLDIALDPVGFQVTGRGTYRCRNHLREWGGKWKNSAKAWVFESHDRLLHVKKLAGQAVVEKDEDDDDIFVAL